MHTGMQARLGISPTSTTTGAACVAGVTETKGIAMIRRKWGIRRNLDIWVITLLGWCVLEVDGFHNACLCASQGRSFSSFRSAHVKYRTPLLSQRSSALTTFSAGSSGENLVVSFIILRV